MARKPAPKAAVTDNDILRALAFAIATGDIVNFRFLFLPYSPLRDDSTEDLHTDKYSYLLPPDGVTEPTLTMLTKAARPVIAPAMM